MADLEKVLRGWERCEKCNFPSVIGDNAPYLECEYTIGMYCGKDRLVHDTLELLKEQRRIIEQYQKADTFLDAHGWKWE